MPTIRIPLAYLTAFTRVFDSARRYTITTLGALAEPGCFGEPFGQQVHIAQPGRLHESENRTPTLSLTHTHLPTPTHAHSPTLIAENEKEQE